MPLGLRQLFLSGFPLGDVAQHRTEFGFILAAGDPPHGHEKRDQPTRGHLTEHFSSVIQYAGDPIAGQAVKVVARGPMAFRSQKLDKGSTYHVCTVGAEKSFRGSVDFHDRSVPVKN